MSGKKDSPEKILLTGASGFVGANLTQALRQAGHDVHVMVRTASPSYRLRREMLEALPAGSRHEVDLGNEQAVRALVEKLRPQWVIHLAMHGDKAGQTPEQTRQVNVGGTRNILEALDGAPEAALVHTGSSSEYGESKTPMREEQEPRPASEYGKTKLEAARMVQAWAKGNGRRAGILRLFSPYGPFDHGFRLIPSVMLACAAGKDLALSSPTPVRDFIYMKDVVSAYETLMRKLGEEAFPTGEIFNVGTGAQHSVRQTAETIVRLSGKKIEIAYGQASARGAESAVWQADLSKSRRMLGWEPKFSFEKGLKETYQWFEAHQPLYAEK